MDQARATNCLDAEREGILEQAEPNRQHRRHRTTTDTHLRPRVPTPDELPQVAVKIVQKNLEAPEKAEDWNGVKARGMEAGAGLG